MSDKYCLFGYCPDACFLNMICEFAEQKTYTTGSYIIRQGSINDELIYVLRSGIIEVSRVDETGTKFINGFYHGTVLFGETALCNEPRPVSVRAMNKVTVSAISRNHIMSMDPEKKCALILELFQLYIRKSVGAYTKAEDVYSKSLNERIVTVLQIYIENNTSNHSLDASRTEIHITHQELAELVCANRVNVSRELSRLQQSGIVKLRRGAIELIRNDSEL